VNNSSPIINNETYFFRDHGQFDLLRLRLLPELIARHSDAKTLRLWSAGCSSGEEAYSLAMLLDMILPDRDGWMILILGTDIDDKVLAKARRGRYREWSFRMVPGALKRRYFQHIGEEWILDRRIRNMVTFRKGDLINAPYPDELQNMDLILCRNVFIYFDTTAVAIVAHKLAAALREGGYLISAHTELIGHSMRNLQTRLFAEGLVYQRTTAAPISIPAAEIPRPTHVAPHDVAKHAPQEPVPTATGAEDLLAKAQAFADRGDYDHAVQACHQALSVTPLAPKPYFLLAQLAQLKGDFELARELLDKTLYLDHRNIAATLELAALCERTDNLPRAHTLRRAALEIVRALPDDAEVEPYETTAAEMAQWLEQ
jgi:chemotaxis protein methyltransferase CheR